MKKLLLSVTVALSLASVSASAADVLKNSLMPTAEKEKPVVDLDNLNIDAKPKSRPATAIVATVDGIPIKKGDADKFVALASKGQVTDIDLLPKAQKKALLNGMASSVLIEERAQKEVPADVKNKLAARYWAEQAMSKIKVSDEDAKAFYDKNKKIFKGKDGKQLEYDKVAQYVKMQVKQERFNKELMKSAKVIIK